MERDALKWKVLECGCIDRGYNIWLCLAHAFGVVGELERKSKEEKNGKA